MNCFRISYNSEILVFRCIFMWESGRKVRIGKIESMETRKNKMGKYQENWNFGKYEIEEYYENWK